MRRDRVTKAVSSSEEVAGSGCFEMPVMVGEQLAVSAGWASSSVL